ncbi:thioredoxin [Nocardia callitridis]|uniref:Thioredoxin n=1 Tax=Nocardia callitridis TaxID=648753 RepID=A0ABP9KQ47_9NOCA
MPTVTLTEQNFDSVVTGNRIVLVDWWADWCGPCQHFAPIYESSSEQHSDIVYGKVDVEAQKSLTEAANVSQYPTLMAFREGVLVYSEAGVLPGDALEDLIQQVIWLDMDQVRRTMAEQAEAQRNGQEYQTPAPETVSAAPSVKAGLASATASYGWPGL